VESGEQRGLISIQKVDRFIGWSALGAAVAAIVSGCNHGVLAGAVSVAFWSVFVVVWLAGTFAWGLLWRSERTTESERALVRGLGTWWLILILVGFSLVVMWRHGLQTRDIRTLAMMFAVSYGPYSLGRVVGYLKDRRRGSRIANDANTRG